MSRIWGIGEDRKKLRMLGYAKRNSMREKSRGKPRKTESSLTRLSNLSRRNKTKTDRYLTPAKPKFSVLQPKETGNFITIK